MGLRVTIDGRAVLIEGCGAYPSRPAEECQLRLLGDEERQPKKPKKSDAPGCCASQLVTPFRFLCARPRPPPPLVPETKPFPERDAKFFPSGFLLLSDPADRPRELGDAFLHVRVRRPPRRKPVGHQGCSHAHAQVTRKQARGVLLLYCSISIYRRGWALRFVSQLYSRV